MALSVWVFNPLGIRLESSTIPVVRWFGLFLQLIYFLLIELPFNIVSPWLFYIFTGQPGENIPLWLRVTLFPVSCILQLIIVAVLLIGAASYRRY